MFHPQLNIYDFIYIHIHIFHYHRVYHELTIVHLSDRAKKPLDMRSESLASYPLFYFQNGGRRIKIRHITVMAVMPLPSL